MAHFLLSPLSTPLAVESPAAQSRAPSTTEDKTPIMQQISDAQHLTDIAYMTNNQQATDHSDAAEIERVEESAQPRDPVSEALGLVGSQLQVE